jgi:hypothetical protein
MPQSTTRPRFEPGTPRWVPIPKQLMHTGMPSVPPSALRLGAGSLYMCDCGLSYACVEVTSGADVPCVCRNSRAVECLVRYGPRGWGRYCDSSSFPGCMCHSLSPFLLPTYLSGSPEHMSSKDITVSAPHTRHEASAESLWVRSNDPEADPTRITRVPRTANDRPVFESESQGPSYPARAQKSLIEFMRHRVVSEITPNT